MAITCYIIIYNFDVRLHGARSTPQFCFRLCGSCLMAFGSHKTSSLGLPAPLIYLLYMSIYLYIYMYMGICMPLLNQSSNLPGSSSIAGLDGLPLAAFCILRLHLVSFRCRPDRSLRPHGAAAAKIC